MAAFITTPGRAFKLLLLVHGHFNSLLGVGSHEKPRWLPEDGQPAAKDRGLARPAETRTTTSRVALLSNRFGSFKGVT